MRLLIDEHLSPVIAEQLRKRGHDVMTAIEAGVNGIDDSRVMAWAVSDQRAVVTHNIRDFPPLDAMYLGTSKLHYGIVLVPLGKYSLSRQDLGPLVSALHDLLSRHGTDDALCDMEYFL